MSGDRNENGVKLHQFVPGFGTFDLGGRTLLLLIRLMDTAVIFVFVFISLRILVALAFPEIIIRNHDAE